MGIIEDKIRGLRADPSKVSEFLGIRGSLTRGQIGYAEIMARRWEFDAEIQGWDRGEQGKNIANETFLALHRRLNVQEWGGDDRVTGDDKRLLDRVHMLGVIEFQIVKKVIEIKKATK